MEDFYRVPGSAASRRLSRKRRFPAHIEEKSIISDYFQESLDPRKFPPYIESEVMGTYPGK
jgi:hypothetical protein